MRGPGLHSEDGSPRVCQPLACCRRLHGGACPSAQPEDTPLDLVASGNVKRRFPLARRQWHQAIQYAEAYEISQYAAPADQETLRRLFPSVRPDGTP